MFTGLVQAVGRVEAMEASSAGARLVIDASEWAHRPAAGDSIAVNGCCLTAAEVGHGRIAFDVVGETLRRTTLGDFAAGARVNLEHSLRADALLGGHFVQGHIDGIGEVARVQTAAADWRVTVRAPVDLLECIVPKGSIALDGVSLTIAGVRGPEFEVALVPTTLERTTLRGWQAGVKCNIETDIVARSVAHWLSLRAQAGEPGLRG